MSDLDYGDFEGTKITLFLGQAIATSAKRSPSICYN